MWLPDAKAAVEKETPALTVVTPSIVQSTLITAGSTTFTFKVAGLSTAPSGGSAESTGVTARQMLKTICSRDTELKLVSTLSPNRLFIIELHDGRYCPGPT